MAKRGRPRKNAKPEEKENPHGTVVLEQLEEGMPIAAMSTDEIPTTWSTTFNETQSQDIKIVYFVDLIILNSLRKWKIFLKSIFFVKNMDF